MNVLSRLSRTANVWTADLFGVLANVGGLGLISYGIGMISVPAGVIAGGVALLVLGKAATLPEGTRR